MGIPRFYRYISERYPLINQPISDLSLLPSFDCFYLDMNGIIHNCTHSDAFGNDEKNTLSLKEQLHAIFTYMDRLITHIIKPKQLVFIAIDGVAPRAKLNQQRSRRFRAGLERQQEEEKHFQKLESLSFEEEKNGFTTSNPKNKFDSNAITPGTEFLAELSNHLVYFIRQNMKKNPLWSRLEVFFSGSEVPGEGEHKIVDFIRHRKMSKGYPPNVRHCMYGSDADLMLLGLMVHEPHFTLVREVVVWGNQKQKQQFRPSSKKIEEEQWQMVHLSLFREYLMMELRVSLPFFDGEKMLDDFILLTFLLGNDFIPHSPTLEISEDAIPRLLQVYREHLEKYPGQYLTQNGFLKNISLLQDLFKTIGEMEEDILFDRVAEQAITQKKANHLRHSHVKKNKQQLMNEKEIAASLAFEKEKEKEDFLVLPPGLIEDEEKEKEKEKEEEENQAEDIFEIELMKKLDGEFETHLALEEEEEDIKIALQLSGSDSFQETKWDFYHRKFQISKEDPKAKEKLDQVIKSYLEALVWCLHYYFQGPPSWGWYYPYHYSPMISDLVDIAPFLKEMGVVDNTHETKIETTATDDTTGGQVLKFTSGIDPSLEDGPLLPFQQLMSNLPSSSSHLVPEPYRFLMLSPLSPIKHFYPEKFEIDMEGKRNAWEGVNLLPFIDVKLLLKAIEQYCPENRLTDAEKKRNTFGKTLRIFYDPKNVSTCFSTLPGSNGFPDIPLCHTSVEPYVIPVGIKKKKKFKSQLMEGVQLPMAGFPSIYTIPLESVRLEHIRVNCFGMGSRKQTFIIKLPPPSETCIPKPENLLGRTVLVNWPHLHEAFVVGISTLSGQYRLLQSANKIEYKAHEPDQQTSWAQFSFTEVTKLLCGRGIPGSGGLDLGEHGISCCLHVLPLQGMVSDPYSGALRKQFGTTEAVVPLQLAVIDKVISDDRFQETEGVELTKRFPVESTALITSGPWLGCTAVVKRVDTKLEQVTVHVNTIDKEPPFGYVIAQQIKERFHPTFMICKQLGITPTTLGVISGGLTLLPMKEDIGLNLKFRKDLLLPGYARLVTRGNENSNVTEAGEDESRDSNVWRKGDIVKIIGSSTASEKTETQPSKNKKSSGKNNKSFSDGNDPSAVSTTWEYSDRAVQLIAAYKSAFPYIFTNLDKASYSKNYLAKEILGVTCTGEKAAKEIDAKMEEIKQWLDKQALGKTEQSKHIPITSKYLPIAAIRAIEAAGSIRAKEREKNARANAQKPFVLQMQPFELFRPNPLVNQDLTGNQISATKSKNKGAPVLGDRVINISARGVPFGARGTVVATHVTSKCVEVLFDEAFTGGEALYGTLSLDRGKLIPWNSLLCVSTPPGQAPLGPQTSSAGPTAQVPVQKASVPILSNGKLQVSSNRVAAPKKLLRPGDLATATSSTPKVAQKQQHDPEAIAKLINKWGSAQKAQTQELPATAEGPTKNPHIEHQHEKSKKKKATKQESVPSSGDLAPSVAAFFSCAVAEPEGSGEETLAPSVAALFNAAGTIPPQPPARSPVSPPPAPSAPPVQAAMMSLFPHNYDLMDGTVCPRPPPTHLPPQPLFPLYGHFPAYPPSHHLHGQYPPQSQYPPAPPAMPSLEDFPTLTVAAKAPKKKPAPAPSRVKEAVNDKQKKKLSKKNGCSNTEQPDDFPISTPLKKEAPSLLLPTQILRKNTKPSTSS